MDKNLYMDLWMELTRSIDRHNQQIEAEVYLLDEIDHEDTSVNIATALHCALKRIKANRSEVARIEDIRDRLDHAFPQF